MTTTPLGAVARGLLAGVVGTLAMDTLLYKDLSAHLVYGTATAAAFAAVSPRGDDK